MLLLLESISFVLMAALCYICSKSDFQTGLIRNKTLAAFALAAVALDVVYYGFVVPDLAPLFFANVAVVAVACLILFYSRSFAGGDCKMAAVVALLFPASYYLEIWGTDVTLILALGLALFAGYCYLFASSVWLLAKKKTTITAEYVKESVLTFGKTYLAAMSFISLIGCAVPILAKYGIEVNVWIIRISCLAVALGVGRIQALKNPLLFGPALATTVIISLATQTVPISVNPEIWVLVLILLLCQITIKTSIYERVQVDQLKKGMILTALSSIPMQASITKGLPGVSTEDLRSRLTEDEIEAVKIWARATKTETLTVVRKIPFAIFVSMGFLLYCVLWGVLA